MGNLNYIMSEVTGQLMEVNDVFTEKKIDENLQNNQQDKDTLQSKDLQNQKENIDVQDKNSTNTTKIETEAKSEIQISETQNSKKAAKVKPEPVLMEFGNCRSDFNAPKASKTGTLQDSFNRFRKKKIEKHKYKNYLKEKANNERRDPAFKENLRKKFVETAKKYYGVPYKRKYHEEGTELYNSPLFLDCCALVRQCVYDLREEFGFQLGRWNQAYQFDTLPIDLKHEEMKPGDLVFIAAKYYPEKNHKPQKHDMVHVEIFTGGETGEKSIGARWAKGVVQEFDSFKFVSKSYYDMKYIYRSIDTWLDGTLKSFCPEHPWRDRYDPDRIDKGSIFANEQDANAEEEESVDNEEDDSKAENYKEKTFYVEKENNGQLIKNYFEEKGWKSIDNVYDKTFNLKWMQ